MGQPMRQQRPWWTHACPLRTVGSSRTHPLNCVLQPMIDNETIPLVERCWLQPAALVFGLTRWACMRCTQHNHIGPRQSRRLHLTEDRVRERSVPSMGTKHDQLYGSFRPCSGPRDSARVKRFTLKHYLLKRDLSMEAIYTKTNLTKNQPY